MPELTEHEFWEKILRHVIAIIVLLAKRNGVSLAAEKGGEGGDKK
jgi:hypothetical protein